MPPRGRETRRGGLQNQGFAGVAKRAAGRSMIAP
jgi:hypothetical protein